jgi:3-hydroxyisobutyrate dehydrogenase
MRQTTRHEFAGEWMMKIGICGTGRMGSAMAERLMELGDEVVVWNRTRARAQPLLDQGAMYCETPAELAAVAEIIICIVLDDEAAMSVCNGPSGLATADLSNRLIIEMSTMSAATIQRIAASIGKVGGSFVECPVGGTVPPARHGHLLGLAAGDQSAVAEARPTLEKLCRRVEHVGDIGTGAAMKLAINLPLLVYFAAVGEAFCITEQAGIDRNLAADILADSAGTAKIAPLFLPGVAEAIDGDLAEAKLMGVSGGAKDLALALESVTDLATDFPVAGAAHGCYEAAITDGLQDMEFAMLPAWLVRKAGLPK